MIGNDIVDLAYSRQTSNWQRPRFLDKVFTASEQLMIEEAEDPEQWVWLLWSIKESTYKLINRKERRSFFAPRQIKCVLAAPTMEKEVVKSVIHYNGQAYSGESQLTSNCIHSIAYATERRPDFSLASFRLTQNDYPYQQAFIRKQLLRHYAKTRQIAIEKLAIQKNIHGIPLISIRGIPQAPALSISHHGYFAAYAICP